MKNKVKALIKAIYATSITAIEQERRFCELCADYGTDFVGTCFVEMMKTGEL